MSVGRSREIWSESSDRFFGRGAAAKVARTIIFALLPAFCTSCAPSHAHESGNISQLLIGFAARHCSMQTLDESAGPTGAVDFAEAEHWVHHTLLRDPRVRILLSVRERSESAGALTYEERGVNYRVSWKELHPPGVPGRDTLTVRACLFEPKSLVTVDTDREGAAERILFIVKSRYSWIGRQLFERGLLTGNNAFPRVGGFEQVAMVDRNTAHGRWVLKSVELNQ